MFDNCQRSRHQSDIGLVGLQQRRSTVDQSIRKYKDHFSFLRDAKFIRELENDSVDSDIIDEELSALRQSASLSTREKVVKFLQSNPVQVILCVIVLLDAGIVIAQILLDLNSVKEKLHRKEQQLSTLVNYVRQTHTDQLAGYGGDDVNRIIWLLRHNTTGKGFVDPPPLRWSTPSVTGTSSTVASPAPDPVLSKRNTSDVGSPVHFVVGTGNETSETMTTSTSTSTSISTSTSTSTSTSAGLVTQNDHDEMFPPSTEKLDSMSGLAHGLHFASIGMLGFLVLEDLVKMAAMGRNFCRHRIEIVDAIIIISSFTVDVVLLSGVSGEEGQKAVAILVVLLLWRIARVVDGIVVTVKQRQEFRIRLQKRARRAAERKLDSFEEERLIRTKQIEALKQLCLKAGIRDAEIAACSAAHFGAANSTLGALSSVAHLSVSMTMLMSSTPTTTNFPEQSPEKNRYRSQNNQHRHRHHHHQYHHNQQQQQHHQHQHPQQQHPSSPSSAHPPGSTSGDEFTTSGRTPPTQTYPISTVFQQLFDNDDDYQRRVKTNVCGRFNRHQEKSGLGHGRLVASILAGSHRIPTSTSNRQVAEISDVPSRIESLPNVRDRSPINRPTVATTLSSPVVRRNVSPTRECHQQRADISSKSPPAPLTMPPRQWKNGCSNNETARSNYGLVTSEDEEDNSSMTSSDDSLDQLVLDSMMRVAVAADDETVARDHLPHAFSGHRQSSSSRHRRKRADTLAKFPCRWRRPNEGVTVSTTPTDRSHPVLMTSATVTSGARPKTSTRDVTDGHLQRRSPLPLEASPINCTGVRIVIDGSSGSDELSNEWSSELNTGPRSFIITPSQEVDLDSVVGSSTSSLAATVMSNSSSPSSTATPVAVSATSSPSVNMAKGTLTLTAGFSRVNIVNDDFASAVTPTSTGSQLFLLGDSVK